ncbi:MAG: type II toxin-antitoxin system Phd/YefM family antitoxin [Ktedonobacteraceae bacterium]
MKTLEVGELQKRIGEMLHLVQEKGEIIEVTNRGEVVALLVPAHKPQQPAEQPSGAIWTDFDRLAAEIGVRWPEDVSAVDTVRDLRREL